MSWVVGADGCRGTGARSTAWYVVARNLTTEELRWCVVPDAAALFALPEAAQHVAIDVPIGFPAAAEPRGRPSDRAARALLRRPRSSSVFSPPARGALEATSYPEASALNRASSSHGLGLSKQCWFLFDRMRDVDAHLPEDGRQVVEAHPELCFLALTGAAMADGKTTAAGREARIDALRTVGLEPGPALEARPRGVKPDDIVDAFVLVWTATRLARGTAMAVPETPGVDARGRTMAIWR